MLNPATDDAEVQAIKLALNSYKLRHPEANVTLYRQNSGSIRVRIIDPDFMKLNKGPRHDLIWEILDPLPDDIISQITVLLLLTPEETKTSFANIDFDNPIPSRL